MDLAKSVVFAKSAEQHLDTDEATIQPSHGIADKSGDDSTTAAHADTAHLRRLFKDAAAQTDQDTSLDAQFALKSRALAELEEDMQVSEARHGALLGQLAVLEQRVTQMAAASMDEVSRRQLDDARWRSLHEQLSEDRHVLRTVVNCVNDLMQALANTPQLVQREIGVMLSGGSQ
jgi:hypothetical protein